MGFWDWIGFKRNRSPSSSLVLDELFDEYQNLYLKYLAIDKSAEFLARVFSVAEFRYKSGDKVVDNTWSYLLNIKPNKDENASVFWQRVIYQMITKNEVLIIKSDDDQLLIADSFVRRSYALYDDVFESVSVKEYQFKRSFNRSEVIYLRYNNNDLSLYLDRLFTDYQKLYERMVEAIARNNQIRGVLEVKGASQFSAEQTEKLKTYSERLFKAFRDRSVAIVPMINGVDYQEIGNSSNGSKTSVEELKSLRQQFENDVADIIGIPTALLRGEVAGIKEAKEFFNSYCLKILNRRIEDELNATLITPENYRAGESIQIIGLDKPDIFDLATNIDKLVASSAFNVNEVRAEVGYEAVEHGDVFLVTKNYQEYDMIEKGGETSASSTD